VIYTLGSVIPRLGIFLLLPVYTLGMGPGEFGVFSLMLSLAGLLTIFFRLGLDGSLLRFHFDVATARLPALYWTTAALTAVAGVGLGLAALVFVRPVFEAAFAGIAFFPYGALAIAIGALTAFQYVPMSWFRATERPGLVFWLGIISFAAGAIVTLWLVLALHLGAVGGLIGQLVIGTGNRRRSRHGSPPAAAADVRPGDRAPGSRVRAAADSALDRGLGAQPVRSLADRVALRVERGRSPGRSRYLLARVSARPARVAHRRRPQHRVDPVLLRARGAARGAGDPSRDEHAVGRCSIDRDGHGGRARARGGRRSRAGLVGTRQGTGAQPWCPSSRSRR